MPKPGSPTSPGSGRPDLHTGPGYELDDATAADATAGIFRDRLRGTAPFLIELDVPSLVG
ncbi:hypothetical protein EDD34_1503 [Myceligenerans xiligouense]|uniref:Uncharacterized protein n=1 Tax=Myceligenerans xiligouense TaxID=253184 RepID=A0A3N4YN56_9MICO|nr:hypothetical protein EDD34_1503 [Myceligenerans xiligouense]